MVSDVRGFVHFWLSIKFPIENDYFFLGEKTLLFLEGRGV